MIQIDASGSTIHWTAEKVTGAHEGNISLIDGNIEMEGDQIKGGSFTVDMTTIISTDLSGEYKNKLEGHLKSDDFFSVEKLFLRLLSSVSFFFFLFRYNLYFR